MSKTHRTEVLLALATTLVGLYLVIAATAAFACNTPPPPPPPPVEVPPVVVVPTPPTPPAPPAVVETPPAAAPPAVEAPTPVPVVKKATKQRPHRCLAGRGRIHVVDSHGRHVTLCRSAPRVVERSPRFTG